jgi:uncharacterized membrane protein
VAGDVFPRTTAAGSYSTFSGGFVSLPIDAGTKSSGGLMEDLVGIFVSPAAVFERRRGGSFALPALVQMVIFLVLAIALKNLMQPFMDAEFARAMAKAAEKAAASGQPMPQAATDMMAKVQSFSAIAGPAILPWIIAIVGGIFVWLFAKIVGASFGVSQGMNISAWSFMPAILGMIVVGIFGVVADPQTVRGMADAQLGPARFFDPKTTSPFLYAILQRVDVFGIWSMILTGIGISVIGRVSRQSGLIASFIQWAAVAVVFGFCANMGS